jgi:hypothetical protein
MTYDIPAVILRPVRSRSSFGAQSKKPRPPRRGGADRTRLELALSRASPWFRPVSQSLAVGGRRDTLFMRPQPDKEPRRNRDGVFVGRDAISTMWKGLRVRSVGSRIWFRPPAETFHSFLVRAVLASAFGPEWIATQWAAPESDAHPLVRWMKRFEAVGVRPSPGSDRLADGTVVTDPDGALQALLCLSYDLYSVQHSAAVPAALMARLRHPDQFQGARYELSVAAIFARVGFDIEWIPPGVEPTPEFVARHRGKGPAIAVEAKSKHRPGGLGMAGSSQSPADIRIGIIRLLVDAIRKAPCEGPFVVFVDLNLPPGAHGQEDRLGALQEEWS